MTYCGKFGHDENGCHQKRFKEGNSNRNNVSFDREEPSVAFHCTCADKVLDEIKNINNNETLWITDSGSSIHVANNYTGMKI